MIALDLWRLRRGFLVSALFFGMVRCVPEFEFPDPGGNGGSSGTSGTSGRAGDIGLGGGGGSGLEHCENEILDQDLGETGVDCGGDCPECPLTCDPGQAECDGDVSEGQECETNTRTDPNHCGDCDEVCESVGATSTCSGGTCRLGTCEENFANCDTVSANGCEANLTTDADNCGKCGQSCSGIHGTPICRNSECLIECEDGWADCDASTRTGCETPTTNDVNNCGGCSEICVPPAAETAYCLDGECGSTRCDEGLGDCDGDRECSHDLLTDPLNCGRCGNPCLVNRGVGACVEGVCVVDTCEPGFRNCDASEEDGGYSTGCETNTNSDEENCGACGDVCSISNAAAVCNGGQCRVGSCTPPYLDCDYDGESCEINGGTDDRNCGGCAESGGVDCTTAFTNAAGTCSEGRCDLGDCRPGFLDCTTQNGCETNPSTSDLHCGGCDIECEDIGGQNSCSNGVCQPTCSANFLNCDGNRPNGCETDRRIDPLNCGSCGTRCLAAGTSSNQCSAGLCQPVCSANFLNCDGNGPNGCEVDRRSNAQHCGACNNACETPLGTATNTCTASQCVPACNATYGDCNDEGADGCETKLISNSQHCGSCGRACVSGAAVHATSNTCNNTGVCVPQCQAGWGACSNPENGCTTPLNTPQRCGSCTNACSGNTSQCVDFVCQAQVVLANSTGNGVNGPLLTLTHNLQNGINRMVLLGVAGRSQGTGAAGQARPEIVTYGGTPMTLFGELDGGTAPSGSDGQGHIFYYYLVDPLGSGGNRTVTIDGRPGAQPVALVGNLLQFNGVRQVNPLSAQASGVFRSPCPDGTNPNGTNPSNMLTLATSGSVIYSMSAAQYPGVGSPDFSLTQTVEFFTSNGSMRAMGGYRGAPTALAAGPYTVGWRYSWCHSSVHYAVVIHPAQAL